MFQFAIVTLQFAIVGCASPPSVVPLLRVADRAMADERLLLSDDAVRHGQWLEQQRRTLADALAADLTNLGTIEAASLVGAIDVYTAAREALLRHELSLAAQVELRRENLAAASRAIQRAIELTEKQDALFGDVPDLRRLHP